MRKPNKGSIVITKILIKLKKYMNDKWNDEVVMRKSTFETGQSSPGLHSPGGGAWSKGKDLRGCRPCRGNKDLSQALSEKMK